MTMLRGKGQVVARGTSGRWRWLCKWQAIACKCVLVEKEGAVFGRRGRGAGRREGRRRTGLR